MYTKYSTKCSCGLCIRVLWGFRKLDPCINIVCAVDVKLMPYSYLSKKYEHELFPSLAHHAKSSPMLACMSNKVNVSMQAALPLEFSNDTLRVLSLNQQQLSPSIASEEFRSLSFQFTPENVMDSIITQISSFQSDQVCQTLCQLCGQLLVQKSAVYCPYYSISPLHREVVHIYRL